MAIAKEQYYDVVADRRAALDGLMWQTPVLSLTAQAFLFTIALGPDVTDGARLMSAILALVTALASVQLMAKHRYHEVRDSKLLKEFENEPENGFAVIHGRPSGDDKRWYNKMSSYIVWMIILAVFALAAVTVILSVVFSWEWIIGWGGAG